MTKLEKSLIKDEANFTDSQFSHIRIMWESLDTGKTGHGEWFPNTDKNRAALDAQIREKSREYSNTHHWIEKNQTP
jgi:hypothetical protein